MPLFSRARSPVAGPSARPEPVPSAALVATESQDPVERGSDDVAALTEYGRDLLAQPDIDAVLQRVLDGGTRLVGSKDGLACLFDPHSGSVARGAFRGLPRPEIKEIVDHPASRRIRDGLDVGALSDIGAGNAVAVGLPTHRGPAGLLVVVADGPIDDSFIEQRGDLLRAFAQHAGAALCAAQLHEDLERKESELSAAIQGLPDPIVLSDSRQRIVALNAAAEELFHVSGAFSTGAPVVGTLGDPRVENLLTTEDDARTQVTAGNPPRTFEAHVKEIRVPGGPPGRVLVMHDLTAENETAQAQHDFVAMIGHELRTPLTVIKGFAKTLLKRVETATVDDAREALEIIDWKALELERLIEDLLSVSEIESTHASLDVEAVDVVQLIGAVVEDVLAHHSDREVCVDARGPVVWRCDRPKLRLVVRHLVENALKYSDRSAPVEVRVSGGEELRVDVIDRGVGIVSSDIPRIFDRFHQVDASSTRTHGGAGVGLYLCARLVRMHGGEISVDSTWGKGSTFSIALPPQRGEQIVRIRGGRRAGHSAGGAVQEEAASR